MRVPGLDPSSQYRLESGTTLGSFPNTFDTTGRELIEGIAIPDQGLRQKYFRIRRL